MEKSKRTILVPTDFKQVADYALQHAIRVSSVVGEDVTMFHVVPKKENMEAAQMKLETLAKSTNEKFGVLPRYLVGVGEIVKEIARVSSELNVSMVIMGSESIKGKVDLGQYWALKVITASKAPFVTIQEPPINKRYDEIVFPIDFTVENKEKHSWISYFSDYYVSRFHLIKPNVSDPELVAKVDLNMASAIKCLDEKGARYQIYTVEGQKPYAEEVLDLAVNIRADLIVIMTTRKQEDGTFVVEPHEQSIIANAGHIPVMSINPR
ncbi:MAG TPA: universal stress protein [Tenuifilaceae bacterium]|mgnify:CR=1 FL=1|nr:universal stress protein [Tenuifilaceae bacterium]HPE19287.1 universal stress protein [Tenuifilaceae bacterium]HPJ46755.1 universal stress protein [Tenuifilaceae bacterium]HPQ33873.1 universal stress protein [Tenuifilaceae bacterium]HRX68442.1 universal stress protein [Tenuifilaceae bacterium]